LNKSVCSCARSGAGWAEQQGLSAAVDVSIGTFSKAFGCHGGFVAGSAALVSFLANRGRPYVFSTALPAPVAAAALAALRVSQQV
jgi:8-amino-7-oxononanoate synthase